MQNSFKWHKFLVHRAQRWSDTMIFNNFLMKRSLCSCPCMWSGIEFSTRTVSTLKKFGVLGYLGLGCLTCVYCQTVLLRHCLLLEETSHFLLATAAKETGPSPWFSVNTLYRTQNYNLLGYFLVHSLLLETLKSGFSQRPGWLSFWWHPRCLCF